MRISVYSRPQLLRFLPIIPTGGLATAVGIDDSDLWLARKLRPLGIEFEDGIIVAAAQRAGADYLVTRDERLLRKAPIAAKTPEDALALLRL